MAKNLLTLNNISKWFGETQKPAIVLDHINLTVKENEFILILGKSGCGKSTLLRIIAGLIEPNEGDVLSCSFPMAECIGKCGAWS
jgi:ABC-type sugar transport system ATPase subunit